MALSGVNYALINTEPSSKVAVGELIGGVKVLYDEHVFAADVNAISQTILIGGKLPKGARVLDATVKCPSLGSTGIFSFGYAASADGVETIDADGFIVVAQGDVGGTAVLAKPTAASLAIGKQFAADVQPMITLTEATDSAAGDKLQAWIFYVMD